jgi:hypothetical protein
MNYFAHGRELVDEPYMLAGAAVPDLLSVVDRKVRARGKLAIPLVDDADRLLASVASGVVRHHRDDAWFHRTRAFGELSLKLTALVRDSLAPDDSFRPSFLGHVLVELLLDNALIQREPDRLERYYRAMGSVDPQVVQSAVERICGRAATNLAAFVTLFCRERFLWDYAEDGKLLFRLNQVMRRAGLPPLRPAFCDVLADARQLVAARADELMTPAD